MSAKKKIDKFDFKLTPDEPFNIYYSRSGPIEHSQAINLDIHNAVHLGLILSGQCRQQVGDGVFRLNVGDCYLTRPWEPHGTYDSDSGREMLLITFDLNELCRTFFARRDDLFWLIMLPAKERMKLVAKPELAAAKCDLTKVINQCDNSPDNQYRQLEEWNAISRFFINVLKVCNLDQGVGKSHLFNRLNPALKLILREPFQVTTATEAAACCGMSRTHFDRSFKEAFGMNFPVYEMNFRLSNAAWELRYGNYFLNEIAAHWGFYDASHFSRCFVKKFGISPCKYTIQQEFSHVHDWPIF